MSHELKKQGDTLLQQGRFTASIDCYLRALEMNPNFVEALNNLGLAYKGLGKWQESEACLLRAIRLRPQNATAFNSLGNLYVAGNRNAEAEDCFRKALEIHPDFAEACNNLGNVLAHRSDFEAARSFYARAIRVRPDYAEAYNNLGNLYQQQGELEQALMHYHRALERVPEHFKTLNNMGSALQRQGLHTSAIHCFSQSLSRHSEFAEAHANLANSLLEIGRIDTCMEHCRTAIGLAPENFAFRSNLLLAMQYSTELESDEIYSASVRTWDPMVDSMQNQNRPISGRSCHHRLRVGFVSPDFRRHSVSFFFLPFLRALDRTRIAVFCYGEVQRADDVTRQISDIADRFCFTTGSSDGTVADSIMADRIDVLVDLAGHTNGNRLPVFARKPAPVQATWLGYPGTTGLSSIDIRFTDAIADPPGRTETFHTENLIRLPDGFLCYDPLDPAPAIGPQPCVESGRITFGSFNNLPKINPTVVALWSQLLHSVPGSQLVLKSRQLVDKSVCAQVCEQFTQQGIAPGRIQLLGRVPTTADHLSLYNRIDIALDTFPYNGTTTSCEALWMGVPVITLCGSRHSARVGASILTRVGLPELIARNPEAFVEIGVDLAADPHRLWKLRATLRQCMQVSSLCNARQLADSMVAVFESMSGRAPFSAAMKTDLPDACGYTGEGSL